MNTQILKSENPRYMSDQLKEQMAVIEERDLKKQIEKTLT